MKIIASEDGLLTHTHVYDKTTFSSAATDAELCRFSFVAFGYYRYSRTADSSNRSESTK